MVHIVVVLCIVFCLLLCFKRRAQQLSSYCHASLRYFNLPPNFHQYYEQRFILVEPLPAQSSCSFYSLYLL
ncbi:hypothetical protein BKA61DRAFT_598823 [Leptodontidium sp. MPI-SDFR-AT-0119]|nr:hypothetical protein BKA61DRAFT_598823 [Leptodontidium sp. MPI-SDFR-AT-0119]